MIWPVKKLGCGIARPRRPGCLNRFGDHGLTMPAFAWRSARPAAPAFSDHCPAPSADCQGEPVVPFQPAARPLLGARRPRDRRAESVHSCGGSRRRKCKNAPAPRCPAAGNAARQCGPAGGAGFPDRCRRHGRRRRLPRSLPAPRPAATPNPSCLFGSASRPLRGGRRPCERGPRASIRAAAPECVVRAAVRRAVGFESVRPSASITRPRLKVR